MIMQVTINAKPQSVPTETTVAELIELLELQNKRLAIEINQELVPRSTFDLHKLAENDHVEIVQAIGGG